MDQNKHQNNGATKEQVGAASSRTVWRVLGVPADFDKKRLKRFLQHHPILQIEPLSNMGPSADGQLDVMVRTLAGSFLRGHQVATVRFNRVPARLASLPQNEELVVSSSGINDEFGVAQYLSIDQHFSGISNLYTPLPGKHEADILAVCGLGGHAFGSYIRKGLDYMWLCDGLPQELPTARVMIYGYKSRLQQSNSFASLEDYATSFRDALCQVLRLASKPLILIGHSLGGLLIQHALVRLEKSSSESKLLDLVAGALFFGVPNTGMDTRSLIPMVIDQPNHYLVESINYINAQIAGPNQEFTTLLEKSRLQLYCFYETIKSPTAAMDENGQYKMTGPAECLVTPVSATGCLPQRLRKGNSLPVDRTHSDMVKFAPHEDSYVRVLDKLSQILSKHHVSVQKRTQNSTKEVSGRALAAEQQTPWNNPLVFLSTMNYLGGTLRNQKQDKAAEEMLPTTLTGLQTSTQGGPWRHAEDYAQPWGYAS